MALLTGIALHDSVPESWPGLPSLQAPAPDSKKPHVLRLSGASPSLLLLSCPGPNGSEINEITTYQVGPLVSALTGHEGAGEETANRPQILDAML